jgi:type I restriction enzyme S subunit
VSTENWHSCKLNELGFVGRGKSKHRPRNAPFLYGGKYPFVQTGDIKEAELYLCDYTQTYSEEGLAQSKIWKPGTLCITIAANIAETAILGIEACFPDSIVGFIADPDKCDVRFIKYYIDTIKLRMQSISRGTTQDNLSLEKLSTFDFFTPPLPIQRKIAEVLSAYDDLIEVNTHRIRLLEQMAQTVYHEWFGKVDAQSLQEGWNVVKIGDITNLYRGRSYLTENLIEEGGLPFLNLKCLVRDGGFRPDGIKWYKGVFKESQTAQPGDIIMGLTDMTQERRIVARAARVPQMGFNLFVMSMDLLKLSPKPGIHKTYLYAMLRFSGFADEVKQHANGVNVLHLSPEQIEQYQFALPPKLLRDQFGEFAEPIYMQCDTLERKNSNLRRTRDLLLPRLVSGEVEVSEMQIGVSSIV